MPHSGNRPKTLLAALLLTVALPAAGQRMPGHEPYVDEGGDPPAEHAARELAVRSPAATVSHNGYVSVQVNVDGAGMNIVGDAANEPSLAVDPTDPSVVVVGWRQFDSITSNFRQAGWGYSHDGGATWTFPGVIEPGVFRTDPVLDAGPDGTIHYLSLKSDDYPTLSVLNVQLFRSLDRGISYLPGVGAFGGDKEWFTADRSGGPGNSNLYTTWTLNVLNDCTPCSGPSCVPSGTCSNGNPIGVQCNPGECCFGSGAAAICCDFATFSRSIDAGASFETPVRFLGPTEVPLGDGRFPFVSSSTLRVGESSRLYVAGDALNVASTYIEGPTPGSFCLDNPQREFLLLSSDDAAVATEPTFSTSQVPLGGGVPGRLPPNPAGGISQTEVAVDLSGGPRHGDVYVMAGVVPDAGADPLDLHIVRSSDGGQTWTAPVRVHDDAPGNGAYQWFGTFDISPTGRLDAVWNDTRNSGGDPALSELFYSYSTDGGATWSPNVAVTPQWNSHVGWPNQNKLGDYYDIVADREGAAVSYAATFNGEQDVYFLRVFPDCNDTQVSDVAEIDSGASSDVDADFVPDECVGLVLVGPDPGIAGPASLNTWSAGGGQAGDVIRIFRAEAAGSAAIAACPGLSLGLDTPRPLGRAAVPATAELSGAVSITRPLPPPDAGKTLYFQAVNETSCELSEVVVATLP